MLNFLRNVNRKITASLKSFFFGTADVIDWLSPDWIFRFLKKAFFGFFSFHAPEWISDLAKEQRIDRDRPNLLVFLNPVNWFWWTFRFVKSWIITRPLTSIGPSVPAIVFTALVGWFMFQGVNRSSVGHNYRFTLGTSVERKDWDTAKISAQRLISLYPGNATYVRQLADIQLKAGEKEQGERTMMSLAVNDEDPAAALWVVSQILKLENVDKWPAEKHQLFRQLMNTALTKQSDTRSLTTAKTIMGYYLVEANAPQDALRYLTENADSSPDLYLVVAVLARQTGNAALSKSYAAKASKYYQEIIATQANDVKARIAEAQALSLLGQFEQAIQKLSEASTTLNDKSLIERAAITFVEWSSDLILSAPNNQETLVQRLVLLKRALDLSPGNPVVAEAVAALAIECAGNQEQQITTLRAALAQGVEPGMMHFIEGTTELIQGNHQDAMFHLELAAKTMKDVPGILNNMAVAIAAGEKPDYGKALELAEAALSKLEGHPYILETRGQILAKMGRYEEAVVDLEKALQAVELRPQIYPTLALAYKSMGNESLAKNYHDLSVSAKEAAAANEKQP